MERFLSLKYDITKYDFVFLIKDLFKLNNLEDIHKLTKEEYKEQFEVGKDSSTIYHKMFYDNYRADWPELQNLYDKFVKEVVSINFTEEILYQKFPTFRVHLPNNVAVGAFHNDAEFEHPDGEVNFIIPLTNSKDTASVWVESEPGKKDFAPIPMIVGELIEFNGNKLTHGNKTNLTNKTRVSMDFRILPISKYDENNTSKSITRKTKFKEGEYYKKIS